jgi:FkbM family methyltransferase
MTVTDMVANLANRIGRRAGRRLPAGSALGDGLRVIRRHLPRRPPERPIGQVIFAFARHHPRAFVVQVGAHDGTAIDPLREELLCRRWRGILVEPVPYVFDRLKANYGANRRLVLENAAIAESDGIRDFHHLPEAEDGSVWMWYDALGSFRREVILRHDELVPDIESRLVTSPVHCLTFESLCRKHLVDHIDVVQIDTEGYDLEVLRLIDLQRWRPALVMYEHLHLDGDERLEAGSLLDEHGYLQIADGMDTLGIHRSILKRVPELARLWERLVAESDRGER